MPLLLSSGIALFEVSARVFGEEQIETEISLDLSKAIESFHHSTLDNKLALYRAHQSPGS